MPTTTQVVASRLAKYKAQIEQTEYGGGGDIDAAILKYVICQLVDASIGGGGGGGTTAQTVSDGINQSSKIDDIIAKLVDLNFRKLNADGVQFAINQTDVPNIKVLLQEISDNLVNSILAAITNSSLATDAFAISNIISPYSNQFDFITNQLSGLSIKTASLGAATIVNSSPVSIASDQVVPVVFTPDKTVSSVSNRTIAIGGNPQLIAADPARTYFEIQNTSTGDLRINFGSDASSTQGIKLVPDSTWYSPDGFKLSFSISVWGATSGQQFAYVVG